MTNIEKRETHPPCRFTCDGITVWQLEIKVSGSAIPIILFRSTGGPLTVDEREQIFDIFLEEAKTQKQFVAVYNMLEGLESFPSHLAAMTKLCFESRSITNKSLMFTIAILGSPTSRLVLNALLAVVPPSKPLYVVGSEEEAWKVVSNGRGTSSELWSSVDAPL
jgi:hypothetical protein